MTSVGFSKKSKIKHLLPAPVKNTKAFKSVFCAAKFFVDF